MNEKENFDMHEKKQVSSKKVYEMQERKNETRVGLKYYQNNKLPTVFLFLFVLSYRHRRSLRREIMQYILCFRLNFHPPEYTFFMNIRSLTQFQY